MAIPAYGGILEFTYALPTTSSYVDGGAPNHAACPNTLHGGANSSTWDSHPTKPSTAPNAA